MEVHESHYWELLDGATLDAALEHRERTRVLEQVQREAATFLGTLLDLAEARVPVQARLDIGSTIAGTVDLLGTELVAIAGTWLTPRSLVLVRPVGRAGPATGDRAPVTELDLLGLLARMVEERPRVVLLVPGEPLRGELFSVGDDVLTLQLDGDRPVAYVPIEAVRGVRYSTS